MSVLNELVKAGEDMLVNTILKHRFHEVVPGGRAKMRVVHQRPQDFKRVSLIDSELIQSDSGQMGKFIARGGAVDRNGLWLPDPNSYINVDDPEEVWNQITNSGRDQLHLQGYGTAGLATNGFNYIGLTNTAITPAAGDTSLSGEITSNGLSRAQGAYAHTAGTNTTTIQNTFTASGTQSCQAAALFNLAGPPVAGVMNHELTFTQRSLISGDTIQITYTITLG